jgi:hypothetical protein
MIFAAATNRTALPRHSTRASRGPAVIIRLLCDRYR